MRWWRWEVEKIYWGRDEYDDLVRRDLVRARGAKRLERPRVGKVSLPRPTAEVLGAWVVPSGRGDLAVERLGLQSWMQLAHLT
jgi:hypothetical protein